MEQDTPTKEAWAQAFHLKKSRAPHRTTYSRILGRVIEVAEFEQVVREYFASRPQAGCSILIVLDGKTLRGTIPAGQTQGLPVGGISAWGRLGDGASGGGR